MRRKTTSVVAVLAALALALPAAATSADTADTLISHGYDAEKAQLLFSVLDAEEAEEAGEYECVEPEGVDGDAGGDTADEKIAESDPIDEDETNGESEDPDDDFECELTVVDVTGPEGQVNHGMVVSSVVHVLKSMGYKGIGCIVRVFAQSDYGKGDQQIKVSDDGDDNDFYDSDADIVVEDPDTSEESTTELEESLTTCRDGNKGDDRDNDKGHDEEDDKDDEDRDRQERKSEERAEKGKPFGDDHPSARKGRNGHGGDEDDDKSDGPKKQKSQKKSENTSRGGPDGKGSERGKGKPGK